MKFFIILAMVAAAALAAPADRDATIVEQVDVPNTGTGDYQNGFATSNGIKSEQQGQLVNANSEIAAVIVRGAYEYVGPDGNVYALTYTADQNGFHPEAKYLPKQVVV